MLFSWSQSEYVQCPCQGVKVYKFLSDTNQSPRKPILEIPRNSQVIISAQPQFSQPDDLLLQRVKR